MSLWYGQASKQLCTGCYKKNKCDLYELCMTIGAGHYKHHLNSGCSYLPIESAIEGILLQPESAPLSSIESALQANLVRRFLSMSPDKM